jgi:hypothetical protein
MRYYHRFGDTTLNSLLPPTNNMANSSNCQQEENLSIASHSQPGSSMESWKPTYTSPVFFCLLNLHPYSRVVLLFFSLGSINNEISDPSMIHHHRTESRQAGGATCTQRTPPHRCPPGTRTCLILLALMIRTANRPGIMQTHLGKRVAYFVPC